MVRSDKKAKALRHSFPSIPQGRLKLVVVPSFYSRNAFQDVLENSAPLHAVIHTASPFKFNVANVKEVCRKACNGVSTLAANPLEGTA